jgi:hypothetical protein
MSIALRHVEQLDVAQRAIEGEVAVVERDVAGDAVGDTW